MPAASLTFTFRVLLLTRVCPARLQVFCPTVVVAGVQLAPLSKETFTVSLLAIAALKVPLMSCKLVLVMKSELLLPVSALKTAVDTLVVGAVVSMVQLLLLLPNAESLPATSV